MLRARIARAPAPPARDTQAAADDAPQPPRPPSSFPQARLREQVLAARGTQRSAVPAAIRARLAAETQLGVLPTALETASSDGFTLKYLLALHDAEKIETVLMRFTGRVTACVSSQVGCAMGCVFCATGQMGYTRHLSPGEIVAQAVHVARALRTARDDPNILRQLQTQGQVELSDPQAFAARIRAETAAWGEVIRRENITLD